MKSVIILLALVAFCQAAPLDSKESKEQTSLGVGPISPDVISEPKPTEGKVVLLKDSPLNRQKRDELKKPDSVKAHEGLQHNPHRQPVAPPPLAPAKPDSVKAHEGLQHNPHKREAHHEPGHQEQPQVEELPVPHTLPTAAPAVELAKKEKRDTEQKPDSVRTKESLAHHEHPATLQADSVKAHTDEHTAEKRAKREAHHEEGHQEQPQAEDLAHHALPATLQADSVKAHTDEHTAEKKAKREAHHEEGHQEQPQAEDLAHHALPATLQADSVKAHTDEHPAEKKAKREAHHEEGHQEQPHTEELPVPHALPSAAPAVDLVKKQEKRETQVKPDSVQASEPHAPHELGAADIPDVVKALSGVHPASDLLKKQEKRDIPVPTQTKATAEPADTKSEGASTTPSSPHFKRPVPVDVLLHQKHAEKSTSSSEESKESKEKVKA
ncbi:protein starmaker [Drosophila serrata]|uniref:protein starmaker n=1 Tax=Drosophila serrata TaxID=7274 RepID=UPI000A1D125F|nr:protein starmaker [Drosophila serrata]